MKRKPKQKLMMIVVTVVTIAMVASVIGSLLGGILNTSNTGKGKTTTNEENVKDKEAEVNPDKEFRVHWAYADIDRDFMIQNKDEEDEDTTADYIFIKFTNEVLADNSLNGATNKANYKLNGEALPDKSEVNLRIMGLDTTELIDSVTIKLPDGYLKGVNAPHTLELSKELKDKYGKAIVGDLKLQLSYSKSDSVEDKSNNGSTDNKGNETNPNSQNNDIPKYTIEIGKGLPYATLVMVTLDTKTPENYSVSVGEYKLPLDTKKDGTKVFIDVLDDIYQQDEVERLIQIKKIK